MIEANVKSYVGGKISYSDYENRCQFSLMELDGIGQNLGFKDYVEYYFKVPSEQGWFKIIQTHDQVMDMLNHSKDNVVDIYIAFPNSLVDDLEEVDVGNWEWETGTFPQSGVTIEDVDMVEGLGDPLEDDLDSNENYEEFDDSDYDLSDEDDRLFEENVDGNMQGSGSRNQSLDPSQMNTFLAEGDNGPYETDNEDYTDSDDGFGSLDEADGEDDQLGRKSCVFKSIKGREEPVFCEGMIFRNRAQLAGAISQHSIMQGKDIRFIKNETRRVRAKCKLYIDPVDGKSKKECPCELFSSDRGKEDGTSLEFHVSMLPGVIVESGGEPEQYVSDWYSKHSYLTSYGNIMHPMNGPDMWEKSDKAPIRPAEYVKPIGRPQSVAKKATTTELAKQLGQLQTPLQRPIVAQEEEDKEGPKEEDKVDAKEEDKEGDKEGEEEWDNECWIWTYF
ncbi:hypothetical protein Vadar_002200 [Vaccinium darrowii]|uniref:Uncharacterized protein n=1 Tax=Vaccinium darrowii TaxID=229202 RepID=A0ACB7XFA0_9ERIC|nr:hypothetical protein Vadar_002200 [Vaccinium darrowii]